MRARGRTVFAAAPLMSSPRLRMTQVAKAFGATKALRRVDLEIGPAEVHALIGENGAGKSTLMKILSGACRPDAGEIRLDGDIFVPRDPLHARKCGIAMIYQELTLAPHLSVEENILLGAEPHALGWINRPQRRKLALEALARLDQHNVPLDAPAGSRPIAEQQMVEIARALIGSPKVLIMDEPTSSLTQVDSQKLFVAIRRLKAKGVSVIYISHFLEECQKLADKYTVLRDGETVGTGQMAGADLSGIIKQMVGREMKEIYPRSEHAFGKPMLEIRNVAGAKKPRQASFVLREGEILGIAGLIGAGRTEMIRAIFGLDPLTNGTVMVRGREESHATPRVRLKSGIGLLSENRKEEGLMLNRSLADNLTMTRLQPFSRGGVLSGNSQRRTTTDWMHKLSVKARDAGQAISELSGGNQQKIAIGRLLHHEAAIFLLDEPTRGIDVGSKAQVYKLIDELARNGKAVIFVSSYLPELLGVCDTIGVMCRGILEEVRPVSSWTEHAIITAAIGQPEGLLDHPAT